MATLTVAHLRDVRLQPSQSLVNLSLLERTYEVSNDHVQRSDITVGVIQIEERLNDTAGFTQAEYDIAQECNALAVLILGDFHDPHAKRVFTCEDSHSDDFRDLNPNIKWFIEGVETQLHRRVLFLGYRVHGKIVWREVPLAPHDRWRLEGE